jgi:hypothetical protein
LENGKHVQKAPCRLNPEMFASAPFAFSTLYLITKDFLHSNPIAPAVQQ